MLQMYEGAHRTSDRNRTFFCDCRPSCVELNYEVQLSQSALNHEKTYRARYRRPTNESYLYARLSVFFREEFFLSLERNELYGPTDFLANFGGLLGLFTGFSLLSLAEIVYFLSVRICCNLRLYNF
ncbi:unnamed protein product [Acanthoscelides obtectus]|uniref:Uncharacterized protein n=1 Tax=Acanthoscelides obtectus TaxID=200917 RepID=A0A9P0LG94_ACAOB|nr:unnamed protein product [Acanthoscelides obtectus]CAK1635376.1 Pickpocket protein 28 [Acanthoscelides obtectus]